MNPVIIPEASLIDISMNMGSVPNFSPVSQNELLHILIWTFSSKEYMMINQFKHLRRKT